MKSLVLSLALLASISQITYGRNLRINGCESAKCPPLNGEVPVLLRNSIDCGMYCACDWGTAIPMPCPAGLHFNLAAQQCDWPELAQCYINPPAPGTGCDVVTCPAENGEFALHLPNPSDCNSFCVCNWGQAIYMQCAPGTQFNAQLQVCDWPENAHCHINNARISS